MSSTQKQQLKSIGETCDQYLDYRFDKEIQ